ncbi:MAG: hypothetical protein IKK26_00785 [Clostridia bacterium]|nr:hypothetical protein [Clostridia bacterium]
MKKMGKRSIAFIASVLVVVLSVITVAAYLFINLGPLTNNFQAAGAMDPEVNNDYTIKVPNKGYAVYVRAAIVVNWKHIDGVGNVSVLGDVPVPGVDYNMEINSTKWIKGSDGFYYHKARVVPSDDSTDMVTDAIINSFASSKTVTYEGKVYSVNVDIITQTIQALGTTDVGNDPAVVDAWGVTLDDDGVTIKSK